MQKGANRLPELGQRLLVYLVEEASFFFFFIVILSAVIIFGVLYTILTPFGHGIGQNSAAIAEVTLGQGIYFSIVTFSSLGYGDMHPMGWSKVLASVEVLFGLAMIGIMIAKVTSRRLSYQVLRLFTSDAQKRLEELAAQFNTSRVDLADIMKDLGRVYQSTPVESPQIDKTGILVRFRSVLSTLNLQSTALIQYFSYEMQQENYFLVAPESAVLRVGNSVDEAYMILGQLIISLSPHARTETLDGINRKHISEAIQSQKSVCLLVRKNAKATDTINIFERIQETCDKVPESYFAVPEHAQPDQVLQGADEPQQP